MTPRRAGSRTRSGMRHPDPSAAPPGSSSPPAIGTGMHGNVRGPPNGGPAATVQIESSSRNEDAVQGQLRGRACRRARRKQGHRVATPGERSRSRVWSVASACRSSSAGVRSAHVHVAGPAGDRRRRSSRLVPADHHAAGLARHRPCRRGLPGEVEADADDVRAGQVVDRDRVGAAERVEVDRLDAVRVHRDVRRRRGRTCSRLPFADRSTLLGGVGAVEQHRVGCRPGPRPCRCRRPDPRRRCRRRHP